MKQLFLFILFIAALHSKGQVTCHVIPSDTIACYGDSVAFHVVFTGVMTDTVFQWQKNHVNMTGMNDSLLIILKVDVADTAFYRCIVGSGLLSDTSNDAHLQMHPKMKFDTLYRYNELGCPGDCKGQFKALVSGGTPFIAQYPYDFQWGGGKSQDTIVLGLCFGHFRLVVSDSLECTIDSAYFVDVLKAPKLEITVPQEDTIYLTNPNISASFPDSVRQYITNWEWDFGDSSRVANVNPVTHTYSRTGTFSILLNITDVNGCDTTYSYEIVVMNANLFFPNVFTPNEDEWNQTFVILEKKSEQRNGYIDLAKVYLSNELVIFDRWGRKVYNKTNYMVIEDPKVKGKYIGDWDGGNLSDGVYFYIFKGTGQFSDDVFRGAVTIIGSGQSSQQ